MIHALVLAAATALTTPHAVTVPMQQERGVLLVRASVNGVGPLLFTFDPGGTDMYTTYARERLNGGALQTLCISTACLPASMEFLDGDPNTLFPQHDESLGVLAGSIGPMLLQRYVVRIDYAASTLTLIPPAQFAPPSGAKLLPLRFDANGMPEIAASVDGRDALFELDVRAPTSMLFRPFLEHSGLGQVYAATPIVRQSRVLLAHAVHSVAVGGAQLHDVPFWFSRDTTGKFAATDVAGLLGNNVLSHFGVTLDFPGRRAYLNAR